MGIMEDARMLTTRAGGGVAPAISPLGLSGPGMTPGVMSPIEAGGDDAVDDWRYNRGYYEYLTYVNLIGGYTHV
jgi:hypothetical protein